MLIMARTIDVLLFIIEYTQCYLTEINEYITTLVFAKYTLKYL